MAALRLHPCAALGIKSDLDVYIDYAAMLGTIPLDAAVTPTYYGRRHCCQAGCVNGEVGAVRLRYDTIS